MARSTDSTKILRFPCNRGMHQEFGANAAPPGTFYTVTNSRLDADGAIIKRPGMTGVAATVPASTPAIVGDGSAYALEKPRFLSSVGDVEIVGSTNGDVFARNDISGAFIFQGRGGTALPVKKRLGDMASAATPGPYAGVQPGIAVNSTGYVMFVTRVNAPSVPGIMRVFIETPEGLRILNYRHGTAASAPPKAFAVGATFYVIWQLNAEIKLSTVDLTTGMDAGTTVATLNASTDYWDVTAYDSTNWFLVFQSGVATIRIDKFAGTTSAANATFAVTGSPPLSIWANSTTEKVWVGYYNDPTVSGDVRYRVRAASDLTEVLAETTIVSAADIYGPPLFGAYYDADNPTQAVASLYVYREVNSAGTAVRATNVGVAYSNGTAATTPVPTYHCNPISKPDNYNRVWVQQCPPSSESAAFGQSRAMLLRFNQLTAGTAVFPIIELSSPPVPWLGTTKGPDGGQGRFHATARSTTKSYFAFPLAIANLADDPIVDVTVYEYTVGDQEQHADAEPAGLTTVFAGGPTEAFGRAGLATSALHGGLNEIGFAHRPTVISVTAAGGGTEIAAGTYSYKAALEWVDMNSRRHRSEPSLPVSVTTTGAGRVTVVVSGISISQRLETSNWSAITVVLYRTVDGGTTYYRVIQATNAGSSTSFTDVATDATISDNEILYTDGGVLPNRLAPTCRFWAESEERLWAGGLWDPFIIECSKVAIPGEPWQFTNDPTHQVVLAAPCTGLAYMDGSVVAFTKNEIYLVSGDGPNDQGIGPFPPPRKTAQGVGCVDYRSIVETNIGVFFQSKRGIELLPRGFGPVVWVGKSVKDVLQVDGLTDCLGAIALLGSEHNLVRFMMKTPASSGSTTVLTYDIDRGEWFKDTVTQEMGAIGAWTSGSVFASSTLSSALTAPFWLEDGAQPGDGSTNAFVVQTITMARIYPFPGGACGWGCFNKVQFALEPRGSQQTLTPTIRVDENSSQTPTAWTVTSGVTVAHREILPVVRQGASITISAVDAAVNIANKGFRWIDIAIEIDTDGGLYLVSANNNERA